MAEGLREILVGDWWRYGISGLGALMLAVGVGSVLLDGQLTGEEFVQVSSLIVVCLLLMAFGARVAVEIRSGTELFFVLGWMSLGVLVLAVLGGWYAWVLTTVDSRFDRALLYLSILAAGALFGVVVGYYDVRVRDLVERAGREQARREFLDEQQETLSTLNGILRHQILNDLGAISGRAELLGADKLDADDAVDSIVSHCDHIDDTVSRIETVVDALKGVSDTSDVSVAAAVERATTEAHESHPDLTVETAGLTDSTVRADELLHIALAELLVNAAVHAEGGTVTVSARETNDTVTLTVADEGPGVAVEADRLFDPNTRGPESDGDGLGLFIARLIVERYEGEIRLVEEGTGATFAVEVPAARLG